MSELNERQQGLIDELRDKFIEMNPKGEIKGNLLSVGSLLLEAKKDDLELQEIKEFTEAYSIIAKETFLNSLTPLIEDLKALGLSTDIINKSESTPTLCVKSSIADPLFKISFRVKTKSIKNSRGYAQKAEIWTYRLYIGSQDVEYTSLENLVKDESVMRKIKFNLKNK